MTRLQTIEKLEPTAYNCCRLDRVAVTSSRKLNCSYFAAEHSVRCGGRDVFAPMRLIIINRRSIGKDGVWAACEHTAAAAAHSLRPAASGFAALVFVVRWRGAICTVSMRLEKAAATRW